MVGEAIAVMSGLVLVYALLAKKLTALNITFPMLSVLAGVAVFHLTPLNVDATAVHVIAELALVIVLFHDASTVNLAGLRHDPGIAIRLLLIGFPLALVATFLLTRGMLPALGVAGAWLLAGALTPTDAGLGAPTMLNPAVPIRVRRSLNVESGLNDGLATPIVLLALGALATEEGVADLSVVDVSVVPVAKALACSLAVAAGAAWLMDRSRRTHLSGHQGRVVAMLAVPLFLFGLADLVGANAFIAAFVGGLVFGAASSTLRDESGSGALVEVGADLLSFVVWFFAGGLVLTIFADGFRWQWLAIAVAALTVLRLLPVMIALFGTGFKWPTVTFLGWFGPRGLATIVFGLLSAEELGADSPVIADVGGVIGITVLLSVFAHGFSAAPLARWYGAWVSRSHAPIEQRPSVEPIPSRGRSGY
ncbi:MAG: cation:proton antiporter [Candidatus Nanopelagicales bacterium]